jgi:sulfate transport system substrate-binding protein
MLIELPIAAITKSDNVETVNTFLRFVKTTGPQQLFAQYGFRPVDPKVLEANRAKYPSRPGIFRIDDANLFGGWRAADKKWFDEGALMAQIEKKVGGPTG